jgi:DNA-binding beta-propeller fold protein YncE
VVNKLVYDNGVANSSARLNLAVVNVDLVYFVNYLDTKVYRVDDISKSVYVTDTLPYDTTEPFDRAHYPLRAPSSIAYAPDNNSLIFADTDNDRIMRLSFSDLNIYYYAGYPGGSPFVDNIDASAITLARPRVVDYNPVTGKIFFVEGLSDQVLYIDAAGKVRLFAGTGSPGFSGDGGPAILAGLSDPRAIAVDSRGNAYIADYGNHAVRMVVGGALP